MQTPVAGGARCCNCKRVKPLAAFWQNRDGLRVSSWCRVCNKIALAMRRQGEEYQRWRAAYYARADVKERKQEQDQKRKDRRVERARAKRQTPIGRLENGMRAAMRRLKLAKSDEGRARIQATIGQYEREIERHRSKPE